MTKKEHEQIIKKADLLLNKYDARDICDYGYRKQINTPCGTLNISINDYEPRQKYEWIFTRIENPDQVAENIRSRKSFNNFSGKYNNYSDDLGYLLSWLECYIEDLINPSELGFSRIPDCISTI